MLAMQDIEQAVAAIRKVSSAPPAVGVVLGSGLGAFAEMLSDRAVLPYRDIPHFPVSSVQGHAGELVMGTLGGVRLAVMSGRVHYYEGYPMHRVVFPVRVLAGLGAKKLVVTNAAGSVNPDFEPGDFMIITDHLNMTGDNPLIGANEERLGPRFPDMSEAYSATGREALRLAAKQIGVKPREGVYVGLAGPSYETPAEIRALRVLGADAVGMSTVSEVIAANHAGMKVAGLSVITNRGAGLAAVPLSHDDVKIIAARVQKPLCELLARAVVAFA
jgi:purine-nucleoside phosphorylase